MGHVSRGIKVNLYREVSGGGASMAVWELHIAKCARRRCCTLFLPCCSSCTGGNPPCKASRTSVSAERWRIRQERPKHAIVALSTVRLHPCHVHKIGRMHDTNPVTTPKHSYRKQPIRTARNELDSSVARYRLRSLGPMRTASTPGPDRRLVRRTNGMLLAQAHSQQRSPPHPPGPNTETTLPVPRST